MRNFYIKKGKLCIFLIVLFVFMSCGEDYFKVEGEIAGAKGESVVVEKSDYKGRWIAVDSTQTDNDGSFSVKVASPAAPEIYRLAVAGKYIYFPIDSVEKVTVRGDLATLSSGYTLEGTDQAVKFAEFDRDLMKALSDKFINMTDFKRSVYQKYMRDDRGGLLSYYVLTKTVNGKFLYDAVDKDDAKYYAAVATAFKQFRPNDPRVKYLEDTALEGMRRSSESSGRKNVMQAQALNMIEIELPDVNGQVRRLSDELSHKQATVVIFSLMNESESPALNKRLAEILASKSGRVRFYHISYDRDMYAWRDAARNLPWTNVYDIDGQASMIPMKYNVRNFPSFYIYNASGELVDKAENLDQLHKKLAGY